MKKLMLTHSSIGKVIIHPGLDSRSGGILRRWVSLIASGGISRARAKMMKEITLGIAIAARSSLMRR
jgi:hypothetical protein